MSLLLSLAICKSSVFLLALEHFPPFSQHFFLSCSSCLSHSLQLKLHCIGKRKGRTRAWSQLPPCCLLHRSILRCNCPDRESYMCPKPGCSTTQGSCPAVLGNDTLARRLQRDYASLTLWGGTTGQARLKTPLWDFQSWGFTDSYCTTGSLRDGNLLITHIALIAAVQTFP